MPINLHGIANKFVSILHPNQDVIIIRCIGYQNEYGNITVKYGSCEKTQAQIQALSSYELQQSNLEVLQTEISRKFYITTKGAPLSQGNESANISSDFIYTIKDKKYWRVFSIGEDYNLSGWSLVYASMQGIPPIEVSTALTAFIGDSNDT